MPVARGRRGADTPTGPGLALGLLVDAMGAGWTASDMGALGEHLARDGAGIAVWIAALPDDEPTGRSDPDDRALPR